MPVVEGCPAQPSVLIVDDDPTLSRVYARVLARGFTPVLVGTAEEALDLIRAGAFFEAILCDFRLPGMTGGQLFRCLSEAYPAQAARFAIVSGLALDDCESSGAEGLRARWLAKPMRAAELLSATTRIAGVSHAAS
ncbi:MAG: hypothetical protein JWP97_6500 [Labilithrix sp.]|nr:hypothetical protein [Labilithrix sp.]